MIAWFARHDVAANLLMVSILALGLMSLFTRIPLEVFPSVEPRSINVNISIPGATPEEVEESVTVKVEEAVQDLEGLAVLSSRSSEGHALITLEAEQDYHPQDLLTAAKNRVDAINTLPVAAEKPVISLNQWTREVISVVVSAPYSEREIRQHGERIRDDLLRIDGISQVKLDGVRDYEVTIEVRDDILKQYRLTLQQVAEAIEGSSLDISAGALKTDKGDVLIRSKGQAYRYDDFAEIVVLTQRDGSVVRLGEVASIRDAFVEDAVRTRFNGRPAALVDVYRVGNQSAIDVADRVKDYLAEITPRLPQGVAVTYWRDRSSIVKKRLNTLSSSAIQGGILVVLLLTLFLRPSIAFWVFIGVPISFMGAFLVMPFFDVTLNIFTLFAFILVLGIVVDDAIVTGENVYTHLSRGQNGLDAAIEGTREVAVPVTFGILTTMAAFLPIAFIEGTRGQLFAQIVVVVVPILAFSLIESKLILPAHLKSVRIRKATQPRRLERWQQRFADGFERFVLRFYLPLLKSVLSWRYLFIAVSIAVLMLLAGLYTSGWVKFVFFPRVQSEVARASLEMPIGTPFEVTDRHIVTMTSAAEALKRKYNQEDEPVILDILATTGSSWSSSASHYGRVMFEIVAPEERTSSVTSAELVREWRRLIGQIPGAESVSYRAEIGRVNDPVDIQLRGNSIAELREVGDALKQHLSTYPSVYDITDTLSDGKEELQLVLKPQAYALGMTRAGIARQVRQANYGIEVQRIQRGRDEVKVMLRLSLADRRNLGQLEDLLITGPEGQLVPLAELVSLQPGLSPSVITRIDRYRTLNVRADVNKAETNMVALQADTNRVLDRLLQKYPSISVSWEGEAKEQRDSFGSLKWGLLFVIFVIYCLLAIPFRSYIQPFIVMTVIPFGAIGAVAGHIFMGLNLTLISLLGMLALIGVVVNDSLVLVDFINQYRRRGGSVKDAIMEAGARRFRPVMLTSITTFVGLLPLLFEKTTQAQFLIPMAVSLGFGILFATVLTLLLVPVNYLVIEDLKAWWYGNESFDERQQLQPITSSETGKKG